MKKEKIHLEYLLNATSKNILWGAISTPTGLEDWFADKVISEDKIVEGINKRTPILYSTASEEYAMFSHP